MIGAVPKHITCSEETNATCTIIWCIYLSSYPVNSILTRLVKKADGYGTPCCLLVISNQQLLSTCKEGHQCGPSRTSNEEGRTLVTRGRVYWHRSRGCENNRLRRMRTFPKNLGWTKRRNPLVIYNIELASYFLPIPITIRRRSLLLPLAKPYTSEIITNDPSTISTPLARTD